MEKIKKRLNIIDKNGKIIKEESRKKIHKKGLLHKEIHVLIYNNKKEILFQKRSKNKDTFPNLLDISVGGHVNIGEDYLSAALREIEEETGIIAQKENLIFFGKIKSKSHDNSTGMINNVLRNIYAYYFSKNKKELSIEKGEATHLQFWPIQKLLNLTKKEKERFIPTVLSKKYLEFYKKIDQFKI